MAAGRNTGSDYSQPVSVTLPAFCEAFHHQPNLGGCGVESARDLGGTSASGLDNSGYERKFFEGGIGADQVRAKIRNIAR